MSKVCAVPTPAIFRAVSPLNSVQVTIPDTTIPVLVYSTVPSPTRLCNLFTRISDVIIYFLIIYDGGVGQTTSIWFLYVFVISRSACRYVFHSSDIVTSEFAIQSVSYNN